MTQSVEATGQATESVGLTTTSGIRRLNPADGLFLRSEHLAQMQVYTAELSRAGGIAGGTGVAYGFGLALDDSSLTVTPGLAIDPEGRVLRSTRSLTLDLADLTVRPGRFWVVEVATAPPHAADSEPVYGDLCGDPCAVGTIQPWLDDVVRVQVSPNDTLPGLESVPVPAQLRNWLASAYVEQERRNGGPWLTPDAAGTVPALLGLPWSGPMPEAAPSPAAVPIGALLRVEDRWVLDVWIARRDLLVPPARSAWEWRLGWRPWAAFIAQVLQFQAQLADTPNASAIGDEAIVGAQDLFDVLLKNPPRSKKAVQEVWDRWRDEHRQLVLDGSLTARGFRELPPAGFLPMPMGERDLESQLQEIFGGGVEVRLRHGSADAALRAVSQAQHLDRIPLTATGRTVPVEVWVPDVPADLPALSTTAYGWVAFVRDRSAEAVAAPLDEVSVYLLVVQGDETARDVAGRLDEGWTPDLDPVAVLTYPAAEWGVPQAAEVHERILRAVRELIQQDLGRLIGVVGSADGLPRRPLATARAALLAVALHDGVEPGLIPTFVVAGTPEAIWLVIGAGQIG